MSNEFAIPEGLRVYAIGDIHGYPDAFGTMLDKIGRDLEDSPVADPVLITLGDYVDRGPDSRGVIERIVQIRHENKSFNFHNITGNHDHAFRCFLEEGDGNEDMALNFLYWGGIECLQSYGVRVPSFPSTPNALANLQDEARHNVPDPHKTFLRNLQTYLQIGDYLFVHAGIRPGFTLEEQLFRDLVFIREPFLFSEADHGFRVVHGHTIEPEPVVRHNRIGIDTGIFETGRLTCAVLEGTDLRFLHAFTDLPTGWRPPV